MIIIGAAQAAYGLIKELSNSKKKAPIDNMRPPEVRPEAKTYEWIFRNLAQKRSTEDLTYAEQKIAQNRINTVEQANEVFSDPTTRFRAGVLASTQADISNLRAQMDAGQTEAELMGQAGKFGLAHAEMKSRMWDQLLALRIEQQRLYNTREMAAGDLINAGMGNVAGAIESDRFNKALKELGENSGTKVEIKNEVNTQPPDNTINVPPSTATATATATAPGYYAPGNPGQSQWPRNQYPANQMPNPSSTGTPGVPFRNAPMTMHPLANNTAPDKLQTRSTPITSTRAEQLTGRQLRKLRKKWGYSDDPSRPGDNLTNEELLQLEYGE